MKNQILYLVFTLSLGLFAGCNKDNSLVSVSQNNLSLEENGSTLKSASLKSKYIVILNNDADITRSGLADKKEKMKSRISGLLKKNSITENPEETFLSALQGFSLKMTPGEAKKLAGDGNIKIIEADQVVSLGSKSGKGKPVRTTGPKPTTVVSTEVVSWGVVRVGGGIDATGKTAWIIDTGIDLTHPDLNVDVARSRSFLSATTSSADENGHGTHVAGIVAAIKGNGVGTVGVAAGATVVSVRVLDINGYGTTAEVIAGVDYVAANGKMGDVANMSLGDGDSSVLDAAVLAASNTGINFVIAAGNSAKSATTLSPARVNGPNVYTVSAMDKMDTFANFSNYGSPTVDFCAPGVEIYSTYKGGICVTMTGTSMAAPHVAGLLLIGAINTSGYVLGDPDGTPDPIAHH